MAGGCCVFSSNCFSVFYSKIPFFFYEHINAGENVRDEATAVEEQERKNAVSFVYCHH